MRTHDYSKNELDFIARLGFYDVKQAELRRRKGETKENRVWYSIGNELNQEFNLIPRESFYIWERISKMYEDDRELVNPQTRFDIRGLPFD